ncbi:MAG TPA: hypothetical protein VFQ69_00900 [Rhizomicrobium sp.]|nr:hypothetical protein [Rhizomicrobium sp.]
MPPHILILFAVAGGLALSGIVANLYRMLARKPRSRAETMTYFAVMAVAGPSVLFENSTRSFRRKECSGMAWGFATTIAGYWAFLLGLLVLDVSTVI